MSLPPWFQDQDNLLLLLALLLAMWWLVIRQHYEEEKRRPQRPMPMTADELGRFVFQVARAQDFFTWRDLFLNGVEARERLGEKGFEYLDARSREVLTQSLSQLARQLPSNSVYQGVKNLSEARYAIQVRSPTGVERTIPFGTVTQVGLIWRIFGPESNKGRSLSA